MEYLLEISKIAESAVSCDRRRVLGYLDQLIKKLKRKGDLEASAVLERCARSSVINFSGGATVGLSDGMKPTDKDSRLGLVDEKHYSVGEVTVFLQPALIEMINEFVACVRREAKLRETGVEFNPSMLLYGPPGVGKSETAKYIAAQLGLPLLTVRTDSLMSSYLGSTAKNIRSVFDYAANSPCVLFFDEFDAIAKRRDDSHELGELKRVVIGLLQNLDNLGENTVLIAATNHEHLLDSAVWRRFAFKMHLPLPGGQERLQMLKAFLGEYQVAGAKLQRLEKMTEGMSGSDIRDICASAIRHLVLKDQSDLDYLDLMRTCAVFALGSGFSFNIKDRQELASFMEKFGGCKLNQSDIAVLFSVSKATISRRMKEWEVADVK